MLLLKLKKKEFFFILIVNSNFYKNETNIKYQDLNLFCNDELNMKTKLEKNILYFSLLKSKFCFILKI